jgi:alpha-N-arabinofuranosidase
VPYLTVNASRSEDGKKIHLMVVNKRQEAPIVAPVYFQGFAPQRATTWTLTGPSIDATNEKDPQNVTLHERDLGPVTNGFNVEFPQHSFTAIEVE